METGPNLRLTEPMLLRAMLSHLPLLQCRMITLGLAVKLVILEQGTHNEALSQASAKDFKFQQGPERPGYNPASWTAFCRCCHIPSLSWSLTNDFLNNSSFKNLSSINQSLLFPLWLSYCFHPILRSQIRI